MKKNALTIKFSIMQWCYWSLWCSFFTFTGMFLRGKGAGYSYIGFAISLAILGGIAGQAFWGYLCDRFRSAKLVFACAHVLVWLIIICFSLPLSFDAMLPMYGLLGFCMIPMVGILDGWIMRSRASENLDYGFIRLWASAGFTVASFTLGRLIDAFGFGVMFAAATLFAAANVCAACLTGDAAIVREKIDMKAGYKKLFGNRRYAALLTGGFMIGLCLEGVDKLMAVITQDIGGMSGDYGLIMATAAAFEIPMLFFSGRIIKRAGARAVFFITISLFIAQYALLAMAGSVTALVACMVFQGIGFGLWLPNLRAYVDANAPAEMKTSAQTLTDALTGGVAGVIAASGGAMIIESFGVRALCACCAVLMLSAAFALKGASAPP